MELFSVNNVQLVSSQAERGWLFRYQLTVSPLQVFDHQFVASVLIDAQPSSSFEKQCQECNLDTTVDWSNQANRETPS